MPLVGRILIAPEGINGTLSGNCDDVEAYVERMKDYDAIASSGASDDDNTADMRIFQDVVFKLSYESTISKPLFPDLKISIVKEIVSTSGLVDVHDVPVETGKHLSPEEFHEILQASSSSQQEIALIDVRNTFEHEIGYFVDPKTNTKAIDPETTTFSSFDKFCEKNAETLRNKKVMMYCTGGIRCEKASILLKRRGVQDVNQLSGGIHRYLEKYGNTGHFKGLNFTFDKRVAMKPNFEFERNQKKRELDESTNSNKRNDSYQVVGRCVECKDPFDELCGSRVCTVCRDLVLVCNNCQTSLREYHCKRHSAWKKAYFSFLEIYDLEELQQQKSALERLRDENSELKNIRRTLLRQLQKVEQRIKGIRDGTLAVDKTAPRRCRSCQEPLGVKCDGKCWGFWRKAESVTEDAVMNTETGSNKHQNLHHGSDESKMRGRRAKQMREAELEFLQQPRNNGGIAC